MNIVKEDVDSLNAIVRIEIEPDDYQKRVDDILKKYRKQANQPGFRPGMVPLGLIRKQYGNAVKADEINKLLSESLYKYIQENDISILGNPLPKEEKKELDIAKQDTFEFSYDLGLSPKIDIKLSPKEKFTMYKIQVDDALLDKHIKDICKRYGQVSPVEESGSEDMLQGEFVELGSDGLPKEDGVKHTSTVAIEYLEDEKAKEPLIGLKVGGKITVDPKAISKGEADTAAMLGVEKEALEGLSDSFQFQVSAIYRMTPAEVNQELIDKVFGPGNVKSTEEFRQKVSDEIAKMLEVDSERKLKKDMIDHLVKKAKINLPDEFLKRWLVKANDKEFDKERVEKEYDDYSDSLRWQLIQNSIIKENDLKVEQEEVVNRAKQLITEQMLRYGHTGMEEDQLNEAATSLLGKEEEARQIYDQLFDEKITALLKDTFTFNEKEVSYDDFVKLATAKASKSRLFDNISNLLKR